MDQGAERRDGGSKERMEEERKTEREGKSSEKQKTRRRKNKEEVLVRPHPCSANGRCVCVRVRVCVRARVCTTTLKQQPCCMKGLLMYKNMRRYKHMVKHITT